MTDGAVEMSDTDGLTARRDRIRTDMGGAARVARLRAMGQRTARDHIELFTDPGSFREIGTFARSTNPDDAASSPGDGKIGGHATVCGRNVTVWADDITVRRGSDSMVGYRKRARLFDQAIRMGNPLVHFGATGGARIPDTLSTAGFVEVAPGWDMPLRRRRIPVATAIVGDSFGGSSFVAALSDFVVQVRGTTLAVTSPRVLEVATGEKITFEELGGVDVHLRTTGQIDQVAENDDEAYELIRRFLSYLPQNIYEPPPRRPWTDEIAPDPEVRRLVPEGRRSGYDMRVVMRRLVDDGEYLEIRPLMGRSVVCALTRIAGIPIGIIASNPMFGAGALEPDAVDKMVRLILLCDSYSLPLVTLMDVPGFLVGKGVEHDRILHKAITLQQCLRLSGVPKISLVLRKAYGLAWYCMGGNDQGFDLVMTWPGAEIAFMDPEVGASVLYGADYDHLSAEARSAQLRERTEELRRTVDPWGAAGSMKVDEVIEPADTRRVLADALARFEERPFESGADRPLSSWSTCQ